MDTQEFISSFNFFYVTFFFKFIQLRERKRGCMSERGRGRGKERDNPKQALQFQSRAPTDTGSHEPNREITTELKSRVRCSTHGAAQAP